MILKTKRLILRPWKEDDAEDLYQYAKNPLVGPAAGWLPHSSVEHSRDIIREVLSQPETYAVELKETRKPIGCVGLMIGSQSNLEISDEEGEIGYWIGVPYWGRGLIPEAVQELVRYGFEELKLTTIWCAYFVGNEKSRRVQEKCGFRYHHTDENVLWHLTNERKTEHVTCLTRERWKNQEKSENKK